MGRWGNIGQGVQIYNYKMYQFWVSKAQHGEYS